MSSSQEFANENLTIQLTREPGCRATLDVNISPQASEAAYRKAMKIVNKEVSLPGFRKGKAPEHILLQKYSKFIDQEWHELLVQTTFKEALDLVKVYPFNERSVDRPQLKKSSREEGSHIVYGMEAFPEIPEVDVKSITLKQPKRKEVTPENVDDAIMDIRIDRAEWSEITDRPVKLNDYVNVDIINVNDPENPICKNTHLKVEKGKMGQWMIDLVLGKNGGDVVEGKSQREEGTDEESFVPTLCRITINKVEQPDIPEITEDFLAKLGVKTAEELRQKVEEDLNRQADEQVRENLRMQMDHALFEHYAFDVPSSLFEGEKKVRLQQFNQLKKKLSQEELKQVAEHYADERLNAEVLRTLCLYFLKRKVATDHNIEVSQDEILQETLWHLYNPNSRFVDPSMDAEQIRSKIYLHLINRKTNDFLVDNSNIV